ncbi:5-guanidino-2-oxopentanoate decarboxylase [Halomonas cupida]|uniref:5-guanidino-2-oxopentanoate decarboxylase n=1 Tax=Halomonas cupida TaxID=44933 RepID=UPI003A9562BF
MTTCAQHLIQLLEAYGVDTAFGIPGVHTIELYRELHDSSLHHYTPRHEQGAGFMADGYARASGKPAVCFIITGPGMTNIATAMGQALADSVPMLVISSVNARHQLGLGHGHLHEMPSQQQTLAGVSRFSHTLLDADNLPEVMAQAFAVLRGGRPGPVHIEIPLDVMVAEMHSSTAPRVARFHPPGPAPAAIDQAQRWLNEAHRPLVLIGGGAVAAPEAVRQLVERLDAPTLTTINARGVLGHDHPLDLGANASLPPCRELAREADVVLALGTELGETDYDLVFDDGFSLPGKLIRVDIDARQLARNQAADLAIVSDAGLAATALSEVITEHQRDGRLRTQATREAMALEQDADLAQYVPLFATLDEVLPEAIIVGDSTGPVYAGNMIARRPAPRRWFNAATGFGTLGYALPAALGASIAQPQLPVLAMVGDGGLQFVLGELGTARDLACPLALLIWNNDGYDEIRRYMSADGVAHVGVNLKAPDFAALAESFECRYLGVGNPTELADALEQVKDSDSVLIIEVDAARWQASTVSANTLPVEKRNT